MSKNRKANALDDFGRTVDGVRDRYKGASIPGGTSVEDIIRATGYTAENIAKQMLIAYGKDNRTREPGQDSPFGVAPRA